MGKYFRHARFKSFLRQLSMYKFQRITSGPNRGAYGHRSFVRGQVELSSTISRGEKLPSEPSEETSIVSPAAARKVTSSCRPLAKVLSASLDDYNFDLKEATSSKFTRSLSSLPTLDLRLFNCTVSLNLELSTPADILDEIISTFVTSPSPTHHSSYVDDFDISDELNFLLT